MAREPKINVQAVVEALMERIAALELEVAVLKTMLNQEEEAPTPTEGEAPETGQYL